MPDEMDLSVVICTHDGAERIPAVLDALRAQAVPEDIGWEVVLVDNASTDGTPEVARDVWGGGPVPLRVVHEPRLGLSHARARGIAEARGEALSFVDDDNVVAKGWVAGVVGELTAHPEVGAVGGRAEAVSEHPIPPWFPAVSGYLAVGPQGDPGDVTHARGYLYGAGLTVRRQALEDVLRHGGLVLEGRRGEALTLGEDAELCYRLVAAGWRLRYAPELTLQHVMAPHRLHRAYLRRLVVESGRTEVLLEPLRLVTRSGTRFELQRRWWLQALREALRVVRWGLAARLPSPGFDVELRTLAARTRLRTLLELRGRFDRAVLRTRDAPRGSAVLPTRRP